MRYTNGVLVGALIIGVLTAYHLGLRNGVYAAAASAVLLVVAMAMPRVAFPIYVIVGGFTIGVALIGPRLERSHHNDRSVKHIRRLLRRMWK